VDKGMQKVFKKPANLFIYHAGCSEGSGKQVAFLKSSAYEKDIYSLPPEPRAITNAILVSEI